MNYRPDPERYGNMVYRRCGTSGVKLPAIGFGLWQNFGSENPRDNKHAMCRTAFDLGVTYFDLANNYGPPHGAAEESFGEILKTDFRHHRDELIISSKAGYGMWSGPYGDWGSRKHLVASCDQTLKRLGLDYVDIFYHHRFDPETPLEETMNALDYIVRSGRAQYVGISNYTSEQARAAIAILEQIGTPCLIAQPSYSLFNRWIEADGLLDTLEEFGVGTSVFSPLEQGILTSKYLKDIPGNSRAAVTASDLEGVLNADALASVRELNLVALARGQSLAQMALAWVLRNGRVTTALVGASRPEQIVDSIKAVDNLEFSENELAAIDAAIADGVVNQEFRN